MKRSIGLRRLTPLTTKTELRRASVLSRSPLARSALHADRPSRRLTARPRDTGPSATVRALVHLRSDGWCEWPGCLLVAVEIHHRLGRKAGGRRGDAAARLNLPSNLLDACRLHHDLVTSPSGAARQLARESGWLLLEHEDATAVPVLSRRGRVLLADDGSTFPVPAAPEEAK